MHKCKNSDLSWALHSLDCLEASIFKTTFFCQVFAYFTPLLATENDIVRLLSEMTLGSSFLSAQKSPASIWRNFFSRPKIMVFCYQNSSDLLWEKIVQVIEKNFWNLSLKAEGWPRICKKKWDHYIFKQ